MEVKSNSETQFVSAFANGIYPAFAVEETGKKLVFINSVIRKELGDVIGLTCHQAFYGNPTPCAFCPESQSAGSCYAWEALCEKTGQAYKVSTLWKQEGQVMHRLVMAADTSDMMKLNRSVVDYLWLMQELSEMQTRIMDDQSRTMEIILSFFHKHFSAQRVGAVRMTEHGLCRCLCDDAGFRELSQAESMPDGGEAIYLPVLEDSVTFFLHEIGRREEWQETKGIILGIVQLYLENDLLRRRVEWENTHDKATRLYNRAAFRQHTQTARMAWKEMTVIFLDIDNLKEINDTHGHDMGDRLICKAAEALLAVSGEETQAYRMGGDEFVLLCRCNGQKAERICGQIGEALVTSNVQIPMPQISVSMGCAYGAAPLDIEALVRAADARMYENKRARKAKAPEENDG